MKKKYLLAALAFFLLYIYPHLFPRVSPIYEFPNPPEDIVSLELLINTNDVGKADESKLVFQKQLSPEEIDCFMAEIYELETKRFYPPLWGWGDYVARVTYSNGDVELLGALNIEYVEYGTSATGDGPYSFCGYGTFEEVFLRYLE